MANIEQCCILLRGSVYIGPALTADGLAFDGQCTPSGGIALPNGFVKLPAAKALGNVSQLDMLQDVQRLNTADNTGKGNACTGEIVRGRSLAFVMHCFGQNNFEKAFNTVSAERSSYQVLNEVVSSCGAMLCKGDLLPFAGAPLDLGKPVSLSMYDQQTTSSVALVEGVDYVLSVAGVEFLKDRNLTSRQVLRASYYSVATVEHESTERSLPAVSLIFEGETQERDCNGNPISALAIFYRVKINAPSGFGLIHTDGFFKQPMTADLEWVKLGRKRLMYKIFPKIVASI